MSNETNTQIEENYMELWNEMIEQNMDLEDMFEFVMNHRNAN